MMMMMMKMMMVSVERPWGQSQCKFWHFFFVFCIFGIFIIFEISESLDWALHSVLYFLTLVKYGYMGKYICMYLSCMYICIHTHIYMYIYIYIFTYIHTHIYIYICMYVYIYIYIYVCISSNNALSNFNTIFFVRFQYVSFRFFVLRVFFYFFYVFFSCLFSPWQPLSWEKPLLPFFFDHC